MSNSGKNNQPRQKRETYDKVTRRRKCNRFVEAKKLRDGFPRIEIVRMNTGKYAIFVDRELRYAGVTLARARQLAAKITERFMREVGTIADVYDFKQAQIASRCIHV